MPPIIARWGGLAAMLGGVLGILYAPFYALAYFATEDGKPSLESAHVNAWVSAVRPVLDPLLTFASPEDVYLTYGKVFTFVTAGWIAGILLLHARQAARGGRLERWGFRLALIGSALAFAGSIVAYWVGSVWWDATSVAFIAFMIPSLLLFGIGYPLFGAGTLRARVAPRLGASLLIAGGLPGIALLTALLGQITMGLLLVNLGWVVLGRALQSEAEIPYGQHAPA
jgi:hypothetical protein